MEEILIPEGKSLRYRCGLEGCICDKHFSVMSLLEHFASHFAKSNGNSHYNYRCCGCGMFFYTLGMTEMCRCKSKKDGRLELVRTDLSLAAARRDIHFCSYLKRFVIPVLVSDDPSTNHQTTGSNASRNQANTNKSRATPRTPVDRSWTPREQKEHDDSRDMNVPMMRSPSMYADGTPRTPREDDEEEEAEPAYARAMRTRSQSRVGSPTRMDSTTGERSATGNASTLSNGSVDRPSMQQAAANASNRTSFGWLPPQTDTNPFSGSLPSASSNSGVLDAHRQHGEGVTDSRRASTPSHSQRDQQSQRQDSTPSTQPNVPPPPPPKRQDPHQKVEDEHAQQPVNDYYKSTANDESMLLPPPPPPPALSPNTHGAQTLQPNMAPSSTANATGDVNKPRVASTVRVPTRRSRQDALLEENPSPPPVSRRRTSRSPTPFRRSPSQHRPTTPSDRPRTPAAGSRTPAYGDRCAEPSSSSKRVSRWDATTSVEQQRPGSRKPDDSGEVQTHPVGSVTSETGNARTARTVRTPHVRSRQDALLEENPSPPPVSRRVCRSPGPVPQAGSRTPRDTNETRAPASFTPNPGYGGRTPAHQFAAANGSQTPRYGLSTQGGAGATPRYSGASPQYGQESQEETTSSAHGNQTPYYNSGRRTPFQGNQTPYHNSGGRTPAYGSQTPHYNSGGFTPGQGNRTPHYDYRARTPTPGNQTPYHNSGARTPAYGSQTPYHNPGSRTPAYGSQTPAYGGQTPYHNTGSRTPQPGGRTPYYDEAPRSGARTPRPCTPGAPTSRPRSRVQQDDDDGRATPARHFNGSGDRSGHGGYTPMRSPSQYEDGTCRTPRQDDDEEENLPAYRRSQNVPSNNANRQSSSSNSPLNYAASRSCSDQENVAPPSNPTPPQQPQQVFTLPPPNPQFPAGIFGMPPPPPIPPWTYPFAPPPFTGQFGTPLGFMPPPVPPPMFGAAGVPPPPLQPQMFGNVPPPPPPPSSVPQPPQSPTLPTEKSPPSNMSRETSGPTASNSQTRAGKSKKGSATSKDSTAPPAPKPPERVGGSKFLESVPPAPKVSAPTTTKRTHQRKRRISRVNDSDSD